MEQISTIIVILGIAQGLFIGFALLLDSSYATGPNRYLGAMLVLFSLQGILDSLEFWGLDHEHLWIEVLVYFGLQAAVFPPYFLSVLKSLKMKPPFAVWLLYVPFFLSTIHGAMCATIALLGLKEQLWDALYLDEFWYFHWYLNTVFIIVLHAYLFWLIQRAPEGVNKRGPMAIWNSFSVLIVLWVTFNVLGNFITSHEYYLFTYTSFWGSVTIFLFWLTYQGVVQQRLVREQESLHFTLKSRKSGKEEVQLNETPSDYYEQFIRLMETNKLYRDPELSRGKVAKKLGISSGYFSSVLGKDTTKSFNEIINEYRVNEVKQILSDGSLNHFSLVAIGLEMGFKSKSSFFTNFKKVTGSTPSEYKKNNQS